MKNLLKICLLAVAVFSFSACKKCYECTKQDYCLSCPAQSGINAINACYETDSKRESALETIKQGYAIAGQVPNCTKSQRAASPSESVEVCDKSSKTEEETETLEKAGYLCEEK